MITHNNIEQGTDAWHHIRKGKITGTTLKAIMGSKKTRDEALYEIVAERLTLGVDTGEYENPMDRGVRLEPEAMAMFELNTGKKVQRVGFCEDNDNPMIANSPDGIINDHEAVEIKCMGGKNHVKTWLTDAVPEEYQWQVVQYFVVNEKLEKLYFVAYNPDIPSHPMHIIEVSRENIGGNVILAKEQQETFLKEVDSILEKIIKI